ncbi:MAG: hypothetical protein N2Z21_11340, partial [Candidatus Sumerlaeaceae bacterium]|nr:hypothetical protein [Candidatus Sumerlaeaceae bacterium]
AWLAALLFAVHPVHVESVAWIIELKDVLSGFFFLLATFVFFRATQTTTKTSEVVFYIAAGVCYALGVLSKTVAVGWPLIVFLLIWTNYGRKRRRYQVYAALCFLLVGIVLLALDLSVTHRSAHATPELPILQRLELVGRAFWWYVMKLAAPTPLLALYPKWQLGEASAFRWVGTVGFLIVVAGLLVLLVRRELVVRNIVFWSVWYVVLLAPTLGFVTHSFMIHSYVADRYQYLASLGPIAIVAAGTSWLWEKFANRHVQRLVVAGCAVVILVHFSALTLVHASLYSQPEKLIRHTLAHNPQSANLHTMLGAMLAQRGALDEAAEHFRHAKQLAPTELASRVNLAVVSWQRGAHQEALEETSAVLAVEPARALMWAIRAASLARIGQKDEARQAAYKALELDPAQELAFRVLLEETTTTTVPRTEDQPSIPKE